MSWTDALMVWLIANELLLFAVLMQEIHTPNSVASGHQPDANAAVTPSPAQVPGVAADDPSSEFPRNYSNYFNRRV